VIGGEIFSVSATGGAAVQRPPARRAHNNSFKWEFGVFSALVDQVVCGFAAMDVHALIIFSDNNLTAIGGVEEFHGD
jgi:hypothetical protein